MKEQELIVTTFVKLDKWDILKVLLGRCLKIETKVIIPQEQPILRYNAVSNTSIISSSGYFVKQDRPPFGYTSSLVHSPDCHLTFTAEETIQSLIHADKAFAQWRDKLHKEVRNGILIYDVPDCCQWFEEEDLLDYFINNVISITQSQQSLNGRTV